MRNLLISKGKSRYDAPSVGEVTWAQLAQKLCTFHVTSETFEEYQNGADKLAIKDVGWYVGGPFEPAQRRKANLKYRSVLTLDFDHLESWDVDLIQKAYGAYSYLAHTSHSHSDAQPRYRIVFPLARDVTLEEYEPLARKIADMLGVEFADDTTYQVSRVMFWPSVSSDGVQNVIFNEGEWIDPDVILGLFDDWRDWGSWPRSFREDSTRPTSDHAEDPFTKPGIIGAFNRAFDIPIAIDKFDLPYTESGQGEGRYSFTGGSSTDGAIFYPDDGHIYSWHESDPARGNRNAWDLVRVHRFGNLDSDPTLPPGKLESQKSMVAFAAELPEVVTELAAAEGFEDLGPAPTESEPRPVRLDADALTTEIRSLGGTASQHDCEGKIPRIVAAKLSPVQEEVLLKLLRTAWPDPAPTITALRRTADLTRKALIGGKTGDKTVDIEEELIKACLDEHYESGAHLRRVGRQFWIYDAGVWRRVSDEIVSGALLHTLMRFRTERPDDAVELVAAIGESTTAALQSRLWKMFCSYLAFREAGDPDPLGLMEEFKPPVINCLNCEIWFNRDGTYEVRPHDPVHHFTSQVPVAFHEKAEAPEWDRFCQIIFKNADEPLELQRHLEELGGYLIQHSRWLKAWILFHGPKDAGKSTVGRAFSRLLKGATASRPLSAYDAGANAHAEAGLVGKLMLLDEDFAQGALLPDGFIKKISEEKMLTANPKGKDEFDFVCRSLPVVISNHWPSTRDVSDAFRERAMVFPFARRIPAAQRSDERAERMLTGTDLEGLLVKFVAGFSRLRARGDWDFPADCTDAWMNWITNSNPINVFIEEAVTEGEGAHVKCTTLYVHYRSWIHWASPGGRMMGRNRFYEAVDGILGARRRDMKEGHVWDGYALNPAALEEFEDES